MDPDKKTLGDDMFFYHGEELLIYFKILAQDNSFTAFST
jgi:hypothetical protein